MDEQEQPSCQYDLCMYLMELKIMYVHCIVYVCLGGLL